MHSAFYGHSKQFAFIAPLRALAVSPVFSVLPDSFFHPVFCLMSRAAEEFVQTVEQFCQWAEGKQHGMIDARQFLATLIGAIPNIAEYRYAEAEEEDALDTEHSGWLEDCSRFSDLPLRYYRVVFDRLGTSDAPRGEEKRLEKIRK